MTDAEKHLRGTDSAEQVTESLPSAGQVNYLTQGLGDQALDGHGQQDGAERASRLDPVASRVNHRREEHDSLLLSCGWLAGTHETGSVELTTREAFRTVDSVLHGRLRKTIPTMVIDRAVPDPTVQLLEIVGRSQQSVFRSAEQDLHLGDLRSVHDPYQGVVLLSTGPDSIVNVIGQGRA